MPLILRAIGLAALAAMLLPAAAAEASRPDHDVQALRKLMNAQQGAYARKGDDAMEAMEATTRRRRRAWTGTRRRSRPPLPPHR